MELYLISNLEKITSSRHLLELLKQYLDETNEAKRQVLSSQIIQSIESKE